MSLEQALADNTAALNRLATVLATASESGVTSAAPTAGAVDTPKATRTKKTAEVPATTQTTAAATSTGGYPPNEGDPVGTRYFHIPSHNTVYKQLPGDMDCTLSGAIITSGAQYLIEKAELEKKFATAAQVGTAKAEQAAAAQTAVTAPTATAPAATASIGKTFEDVVNKARELHKAQGNAGLKRILDQFGAAGVPALNGKASNEDLITAIDTVLMGL
jgi:hypothetical protein